MSEQLNEAINAFSAAVERVFASNVEMAEVEARQLLLSRPINGGPVDMDALFLLNDRLGRAQTENVYARMAFADAQRMTMDALNATPDLLSACKAVREFFANQDGLTKDERTVFEVVCAAITKAEVGS